MKWIVSVLLLGLAFFLFSGVAAAAPKNLKKHALAKELLAPVMVIKRAPHVALVAAKAGGKGIAYTVGSGLFLVESGVDVAHLATDVLDKGVAAEGWKKNPFHYPNKAVGYADTGLEDAYSFLFHIQI